MKKLSIYVDESGVFGPYNTKEPYYLCTLIFYEETELNNCFIKNLEYDLEMIDIVTTSFHAGPIIRKEKEFSELNIETRRKIFNKMSFFGNHSDFEYITFIIDRLKYHNEDLLILELTKQLESFLIENHDYFLNFDLIIYYDNGQKQLSNILKTTFSLLIENIVFEIVLQKESRLLQLADYVTTLELVNLKYKYKATSVSERYFFGNYNAFKRNYYRQIEKKQFKKIKCN